MPAMRVARDFGIAVMLLRSGKFRHQDLAAGLRQEYIGISISDILHVVGEN